MIIYVTDLWFLDYGIWAFSILVVGMILGTFCMVGCMYLLRICLLFCDADVPVCLRRLIRPIPHDYGYYQRRNFILEKSFSTQDVLYSQRDCTICIEPFNDDERVAVLRCHHVFHVGCVREWVNHKNDQSVLCPVCKHDLREIKEVGASLNSTEIEMTEDLANDLTLQEDSNNHSALNESSAIMITDTNESHQSST